MENTKVFLSKKEVCTELGISLPTLNRRLKDRAVPSVKLGGRILIPAGFISGLEKTAETETVESSPEISREEA
jgi:excisionase family DNA binding protein